MYLPKLQSKDLGIEMGSYKTVMTKFSTLLTNLGKLAKTQDLADNLLIWSNWKIVFYAGLNMQIFTMFAKPEIILWNGYTLVIHLLLH